MCFGILASGTEMSKNIITFTNQQVKYTANMGTLCINIKLSSFETLDNVPDSMINNTELEIINVIH